MTHLYLANSNSPGAVSHALDTWPWETQPLNILIAYPYLRHYRSHLASTWRAKRTMLDSGAFTVHKQGDHDVDLDDLVAEGKRGGWTEVVALDVIGDWRGSANNFAKMVALGSPAMPVFHYGDPWELLFSYARTGRKIGLGGLVGRPLADIIRFCDGVFSRLWPHRYHAFGQARPELLLRYPFDSADSTSWMTSVRYARNIPLRGRTSIDRVFGCSYRQLGPTLHYAIQNVLDLEQRLAAHWARELAAARAT